MAYTGTVPAPNGQRGRIPIRLTFFRTGNDSVRQFAEGSADAAAILTLDSTFAARWVRGDTTKVLSVFAQDAILLPPRAPPVDGLAAIRAYWWPADGSRTRITAFRWRDRDDRAGPIVRSEHGVPAGARASLHAL